MNTVAGATPLAPQPQNDAPTPQAARPRLNDEQKKSEEEEEEEVQIAVTTELDLPIALQVAHVRLDDLLQGVRLDRFHHLVDELTEPHGVVLDPHHHYHVEGIDTHLVLALAH